MFNTQFFQISPGTCKSKHKPKVQSQNLSESEEIAILSLAPFTPNPKIFFEDVKVGSSASRKLKINNPTSQDINLFVSKSVPEEVDLLLSWVEKTIERNSEVILELIWTPHSAESFRHSITLEDGHKIRRDIPVAFKAVGTKKKSPQKIKSKGSLNKKAKSRFGGDMAAPTSYHRIKRISPTKKFSPKTQHKLPSIQIQNVDDDKENLDISSSTTIDQLRRETYTVDEIISHKLSISDPIFNDSLEISPINSPFKNISPDVSLPIPTKHVLFESTVNNTMDVSLASYYFNQGLEKGLAAKGSDVFEQKLQSISLGFSPLPLASKSTALRNKSPVNLGSTFEIENKNPLNISSETYVKDNTSFETYVKANTSSETYVKDSSIGNVHNLSSSPILNKSSLARRNNLAGCNAKGVIEANLWTEPTQTARSLRVIKEESYVRSGSESEGESIQSLRRQQLKRKSTTSIVISPLKKPNIQTKPITNWSKKTTPLVRLSKTTSGLNLQQFANKTLVDNKHDSVVTVTNTNITMVDPFMLPMLYWDNEWMDKQEIKFKKWLNALLTPPEELCSNVDEKRVDVSKIWQECKKQEVNPAPSKEMVSNKYYTNNKLNLLRKSATNLFKSAEMTNVLTKVGLIVETQKLSIREDRDIHLNLTLKAEILSLLLSYNSLWLRIGLETIYSVIIPLNSNSDVTSLTTFLMERLFKDPNLFKKYKTIHSPKYIAELKKFFLKKFLMLVYFLDQAKIRKIINHDPCLFCKNAVVKESREVLLQFSRNTLAAVGDVTKYLKTTGYVVTHKQNYIHEFDYAVNNLGSDLRDGVRLVRIMEIILLEDNLTNALRVPAISHLQKIHNTKIVFDTLQRAGYEILYDIEPKHIVDGYREKTLSFLWQIIYKFQAPLMVKSSTTIQVWFRSLAVVLKRRQLEKLWLRKEGAARRLQQWYRRVTLSEKLLKLAEDMRRYFDFVQSHRAAVKIQSFYRMYKQKLIYKAQYTTIVKLQTYAKMWLVQNYYKTRILAAVVIQKNVRRFLARNKYIKQKNAAIVIQRKYLAMRNMKIALDDYTRLKHYTIFIQRKFRANTLATYQRIHFLKLRSATLVIQRKYRAQKLMILQYNSYLDLKTSTIKIQRWYRSVVEMRICMQSYISLKQSVLIVEKYYLARKQMLAVSTEYQRKKRAALVVQQQYRALAQMRLHHNNYLQQKSATIKIQRWYRGAMETRECVRNYCALKKSVQVFEKYYVARKEMLTCRCEFQAKKHAAKVIQERYRSVVTMRLQRSKYLKLKTATLVIQRRFRATVQMRICRNNYNSLKKSVEVIEKYYSARKLMIMARNDYETMKHSAILIQRFYRATVQMRLQREEFLRLKSSAILIQTQFRARKLANACRFQYTTIVKSTVFIQRQFRANKLMKQQRNDFLKTKHAALKIQVWYRSVLEMQKVHSEYVRLKHSVCVVEIRYLAQKQMHIQRNQYKELKQTTVYVQQKFRATQLMKKARQEYINLRDAAIVIQTRYRATKIATKERKQYLDLVKATTTIQVVFKATKLMQKQRNAYMKTIRSVKRIQSWYRSVLLMREARCYYLQLKSSVRAVESRYLARKLMLVHSSSYELLRKTTIFIQQKFRANQVMKKNRQDYLKLKESAIVIQRFYIATKLAHKERAEYLQLVNATKTVQRRFRANKLMKIQRNNYVEVVVSVSRIQSWYRSVKTMRITRDYYLLLRVTVRRVEVIYKANKLMKEAQRGYVSLKNATITIQRRYRAQVAMRNTYNNFITFKRAAIVIQQRFRAHQAMLAAKQRYECLRRAVLLVQRHYKANKAMREARQNYTSLRKAAIVLQARYRAKKQMENHRNRYVKLRQWTVFIQVKYRALVLMRIERANYNKIRVATIAIQRYYREYRRLKYENRRKVAVIEIQRFARGYLVRKKYEGYFTEEAREQRRILKIQNEAAVKIQAYWRGSRARSLNNPQLKKIRKRSKEANCSAPLKDNLAKRCRKGIAIILLDHNTLVQLIKALQEIEFATRHSKYCCLATASALTVSLYHLLDASARSLPEMNVCTLATKIIINYCKFSETKQSSFGLEFMDRVFDIMVNWCDKEAPLFSTLCTLIWLFAHEPQWKKDIWELANIEQKLGKIEALCVRKYSMVQKCGIKGTSFFAPYNTSLPLPSRIPDWGLSYEHKPYSFTNAMYALACLKDILEL